MQEMKILIISQYWHPENGVPQRRWTWLSRILKAQGHDVTVIAPPPSYNRSMSLSHWWEQRGFASAVERGEGPSGERIVRSGFLPARKSLTSRALSQGVAGVGALWVIAKRPGQLKCYKPDLVIGTVPALPTALVTRLIALRFGVPYIIDLRDAWPDLLDDSEKWNAGVGTKSLRQRVLSVGPWQALRGMTRVSLNSTLRQATAIIATSSALAADLQGRPELRRGQQRPTIETIRNVFPVKSSYRKTYMGDNRPERQRKTLNVLYAGTIGRAQDLANALYAADFARKHGVHVALRFVGAGAAKHSLRDTARALRLTVEFVSREAADELDEHYAWADSALVHLAPWEPLKRTVPSKLYELMTVGLHISGVLSGEAAGLIEKFGAGHAVEPGHPEALGQLWIDLARGQASLDVGHKGKAWVEAESTQEVPRILRRLATEVQE